MFSIANMSPDVSKFLLGLNSAGTSRTKESSISLAKAIANSLAIPSGKVDDFRSFYNSNYKLNVLGTISSVNEITVIDTVTVEDYVIRFLETKYNVAYGESQTLAMKKESAIEDFFGITKSIPCDVIEVIKADPMALTVLVNGFSLVVNEINKPE